jgi:uncharacterized RDD family membrane protein YckC
MRADVHSPAEGRALLFDPAERPELFNSVRTRRVSAFFVDAFLILLLVLAAYVAVAVLGIFTLGLGWLLFPIVWPLVAVLYATLTLGGPRSATPGMRTMGLEMRTWYGAPIYPLLALAHAALFWISVTLLTPFVLLVSLFSPRKRLLHDIVLGPSSSAAADADCGPAPRPLEIGAGAGA